MGYVTRDFLTTQFTNFATRIALVFAKQSDIPKNTSDLTNDSGFATTEADNLTNYYTKAQTYTRDEIASLVANISTMTFAVVDTLPTTDISTNTIYLVPKDTSASQNVYTEYVYISDSWEIIGETDTNLSGYVTSEQLSAALSDCLLTTDTETDNIDFSTYFTS